MHQKIIKIGGHMRELQLVEKWYIFMRDNKMQQIWTYNFLVVVQQHILGVVDNVIYCFVGNITGFPAVKEFWKSVKI